MSINIDKRAWVILETEFSYGEEYVTVHSSYIDEKTAEENCRILENSRLQKCGISYSLHPCALVEEAKQFKFGVGDICKFDDFEPMETRHMFKIGKISKIENGMIYFDVLLEVINGERVSPESTVCVTRYPNPRDKFDWPNRIQIISVAG